MDDQRKELESIRRQIDEVDDAILEALANRAALAKRMSAIKDDTPRGYSPKRQREVLDRVDAKGAGDFPKRSIAAVFREVLSACFALEGPMRVSFEGPPGSIGHEAARTKFGAAAEYLACEGPRAALELVEREHADAAVIVLESSAEGLLQPALDALADASCKLVGEVEIDARVHVLNKTGNMHDVEKVYAAPAERVACARFLSTNLPRAQVMDTRTTAMAAQLAAEDHGAAALGGDIVGEMFGLQVARGNVADMIGEHVRACVASMRPAQRTGHDTTSFVISLDDSPGALFRVLKPLADRDLNLRRIQSRPRAAREASDAGRAYRFFMEVAGHSTDRPLVTAFEEMKRGTRLLKILGSYPSKS